MTRTLVLVLSIYGFLLARRSTVNGRHLETAARNGDVAAKRHFTQSRWAKLLGPRNSDLGTVYYAATAVSALLDLTDRPAIFRVLRVLSSASAAMSLVLLWALTTRLRVRCDVCLRAHAVNLGLFLLFRPKHQGRP